MRYHNITTDDMLNGDGLRTVLWVAGCSHHCKGCQNPQTWNPNGGIEFDDLAMAEIRAELNKPHISGLTLSGGDPLYPGNRHDVLNLVKRVKDEFPGKTIWVYTGYNYEEVKNLEIMNHIDVLVDGEYVEELRDISLPWVGSSNQRVVRIADEHIR